MYLITELCLEHCDWIRELVFCATIRNYMFQLQKKGKIGIFSLFLSLSSDVIVIVYFYMFI